MRLTRRETLTLLAGASAAAQSQPRAPRPILCIFSKHLASLHYSEIGPVAREIGFDGIDLTVRPGGHVAPEKAPVDFLRAVESVQGAGLEVPMITTALTSPADPMARFILAVAGRLRIPFFKPGYWRYPASEDIEARLRQVRLEAAGLVSLGRAAGIVAGFHNHSGDYVGSPVWDTRVILSDLDPKWAGYYFDPCHATAEGGLAGWNIAVRMALPRLKMVSVKDFYWEKSGGKWKMRMCPLGQGMVDWKSFLALLAGGRFSGPISLHLEYDTPNEVAAMAKDLEFLRKRVEAAYSGAKEDST